MIHRHDLIAAGQAGLTLALLAIALLAPGAPPSAAPASQAPASQAPASQAHAIRPREVIAQAAPARPAAKAPPVEAPAVKEPVAPLPPPPPASPAAEPAAPLATTGGMPEIDANYRRARRQLLAKGFRPARVAPPECRGPEPSVDACWGALVEFPEIEACSSGAKGSCVGWWLAPDGHVLRIQTSGDTGRIRDRHWANDGEIAELPNGWRP